MVSNIESRNPEQYRWPEKVDGDGYVDRVLAADSSTGEQFTLADIIRKELLRKVVSSRMTREETNARLIEVMMILEDYKRQQIVRGSLKVRLSGIYTDFFRNLSQHYSPREELAQKKYLADCYATGAYPIGNPIGFDRRLNAFLDIVSEFFRCEY